MARNQPTYIGDVVAVAGAVVRVRLRRDLPSTLLLVEGESYRVGQVGEFFRIPLGYQQLYAVCTQVGADAAPPNVTPTRDVDGEHEELSGFRWMTVALFGESLATQFDRGVGQYPTIGDEVHLVTEEDLRVIYGGQPTAGSVAVGAIAASSGIPARLEVAPLVSRHCCVVGSTGSGKSNFVTVLLESLAAGSYPRARVLIIDPHGEYGTALARIARVFRLRPNLDEGELPLRVPFWALPMEELLPMTLGGIQPAVEAAVRDEVLAMKRTAAARLATPPPESVLTADSPVPFSIKKLWFELDRFERMTFEQANNQTDQTVYDAEDEGNPAEVRSARYPAASPYNQPPYFNRQRRNIARQLDLFASRLRNSHLSFLFDPGDGYSPDLDGSVTADLDTLVAGWIGHDAPVSILDVSGLPDDILGAVVGTLLRVVYDTLYWAMDLPVGARQQPLLVILEEAHRFLAEGAESAAHRINTTIAKEGRKYGVGLMVVSQRPSEVDSTVLSQCGTMIALRSTNTSDRNAIAAAFPDDLAQLANLLPALRTGEGLFLGDAMPIPTRVRIRRAVRKPIGDDPKLPAAWRDGERPDARAYSTAVANWRAQSTSSVAGGDGDGG